MSPTAIRQRPRKYLQGVWKQNLGIEVTLDPLEARSSGTGSTPGRTSRVNLMINAAGSDWRDPANWHNQLFDSQADFYHAHWKNDEFDTLVQKAAVMGDQEARIAQYEQRNRCSTRTPVIPLYNLNSIYVIKPYVQGIYHYPIVGRIWLRYVSILEH